MDTNDDKSGVRVFPPLIYLIAVGIGFLLQHLAPLRMPVGWREVERDAGVMLIALGLVIMVWAVALFRLVGTTPNPTKPTTALVVRGPFRFTRNPMYLGLTLVGVGVGLVTDAIWVALLAILASVAVQVLVIAKEEPYLERKFGADYRAYRERVGRWL